jgi:NAD(P)-dependent dehydrogenase (short-subunit alcohol dehydrogenase family)
MRSLKDLMSLEGRAALVTGGAGHIGGAISEALLELGAGVVLADLDVAACEMAAVRYCDNGFEKVRWEPADLSEETATRHLVHRAENHFGRLDIIVHSAAFVGTTRFPGWAEPFDRQSVGAWDAAMRVNLTAAFVMAQEALPALRASGHGSIIFISSTYGIVGPDFSLYEGTSMQNPVAYGASKGGLLQLAKYLATALAPEVRVNTLTAGGVERGQPELFQNRYRARTPLGRMATEEDFKGAVAYLASDLSKYVTGHNLVVDGGWTTW